MKKGNLQYIKIVIAAIVSAALFVSLFSCLATLITNRANKYYEPRFFQGERGYTSPWYENGLHIVDEGFIDQLSLMKKQDNKLIFLGSSLSRISFIKDEAILPDNYNYYFMVCGNGCYRSDDIFINLLEKENLLDKNTIVKYEISFSTFRDPNMTIAESTIDKWGKYEITEDLEVKKKSKLLQPIYSLNKALLKIQNIYELFFAENNFCNNYFSYDAVAATCNMTDEMKDVVLSDIIRLNKETNCVVEISPMPQGLLDTEFGKQLSEYIDEELIEALENEGITYLDHRDMFLDSEFADGVHLSYNAGCEYTKTLNDEFTDIINSK